MPKLQAQLKNAAEVRNILQEVTLPCKWNNNLVDVRLIYLPCSDGKCNVIHLFKAIKDCLMANFVFSHAAIQKKIEIKGNENPEILFKKAVQFISRKTAHGELGELLLFTLLDVYFEAPKIVSKVSMKTSRRMPVYGADAVHAQYIDGNLRLYLGESKLYKSFKNAVPKATKSISDSLKNYEHEFNLIENHINFPEISDELEKELLCLLDPFDDKHNIKETVYFPCFIGFAEPSCFLNEEEYISTYKKIAPSYVEHYFSSLSNKKIHHDKSTLLMLPFSSITEVVNGFISYMGIVK